MTSPTKLGALLGGGLLLASALAPAAAQDRASYPPGAVVQAIGADSGAQLRQHLVTLAQNPRSLDALLGAGWGALRSGDAEAAFAFFSRADQVAPRHPRVKAGQASAMVHLGQAQRALSLFAEAIQTGAPEVEIAGDRGLAYDMMGQTARAQQDYTLALTRGYDPEVRRRMALSLAIAGDRDAALAMIHDQLRRNIRAAWRTQAFVLALTGDVASASRTAQGAMPAGAAAAMTPFFARLPALSAAEKAMAVHFGQFPMAAHARPIASQPTYASRQPAARAPAAAPSRAAPRESDANAYDSSDPYGLRSRTQSNRSVAASSPAPSFSTIASVVDRLPPERSADAGSPPRHWVQLVAAGDPGVLVSELERLRRTAPRELGSLTAWRTAVSDSHRLLVGPFASPTDAQAFVHRLAGRRIQAVAWTSPAGQEIDLLRTR